MRTHGISPRMDSDPPEAHPPVPILIRFLQWRTFLLLVVGAALVITGGVYGRRAYRRWSERHFVQKAAAHLDRGEYEEAALAARHVLDRNPNHPEACRVIAELARIYSPSDALAWRARVVALDPNNLRARLDWAGEAIARGETSLANDVLLGVPPADRTSVEYHELAAGLAIRLRQFPLAYLHFRAALKRDPENPRLRLNLATLELGAGNRRNAARARALLESLRNDPSVRLLARRALLADAIQARDDSRAVEIGKELASAPDASFRDRLLYLGALHRARSPETASHLAELKTVAARNGANAGELVTWMNANGMASEAIAWARALSADVSVALPLSIALSESLARAGDWNGLRRLLEGVTWNEFEPLRLAIISRTSKETGNELGAQFQWRAAVRLAVNQPDLLNALTHFASGWGWRAEAEQILWELANRPMPPREVLESLYRHYQSQRDTKGLLRITQRIVQLDPTDTVALNNLALFSLLLNTDLDEAFKIARDGHTAFPDHPGFSSTYAFALHRRGRTAEGIKVLEALGPKTLRDPSAAAYYGILLAASGDKIRAREFLDLGTRASLLPPEEALVAAARRKTP